MRTPKEDQKYRWLFFADIGCKTDASAITPVPQFVYEMNKHSLKTQVEVTE